MKDITEKDIKEYLVNKVDQYDPGWAGELHYKDFSYIVSALAVQDGVKQSQIIIDAVKEIITKRLEDDA